MGYFKDAFKLSAGATLGNLAVNVGAQLGANFVEAKQREAYNNYRSKYFDPVVRNDMNELLVFDRLPQSNYPFPDGRKSAGRILDFFMRHKVFTATLVVYVIVMSIVFDTASSGNTDNFGSIIPYIVLAAVSLVVASIGVTIGKIGRIGINALSRNYKNRLESQGRRYWNVREYVRQALASGEMDKRSAIVKISNTELAQQFPDTVDEIEANAFHYRQKMGGGTGKKVETGLLLVGCSA